MKSILVCNQKGGVGKSMIADELAFAMDRCATPYSFYDLDNQGGTIHKTTEPQGEVQIIDTPGALQKNIMEWMGEADIIIIPFRPTSRDIPPLMRMMEIADVNAPGKPTLYVMNAWNRYKASRDFHNWFTEQAADRPGFQIMAVPQSEMIVQAAVNEVSVVEYAPRSAAASAIKQVTNWARSILGLRPEHIK